MLVESTPQPRLRLVATSLGQLTPREREVLQLMAQGCSNQGICERLFLSPKTVESHVRNIFWKLGLREGPDVNRRVMAVVCFFAGSAHDARLAA